MDELKKYIQSHANELNPDEPGARVWQNIQRQSIVPQKPNVVMMVTRWAVAACVLVLAGIGTWYLLGEKKTAEQPVAAKTNKIIAPVTPDVKAPIETGNKEETLAAKTETAPKSSKNIHLKKQAQDNMADLTGLHNLENSFTQVINLQRERVSSIPMYAESPEYFDDFKIQIKQMEKDEKVIKSDIARRGMNDALLDQLINLYQQKLNILKQLQTEMNKTNNRYKQNRGPVDSARTYFLKL
ncbi:MAG: hypothetical protein V4450_00440 [Bacteroidota bacterium]